MSKQYMVVKLVAECLSVRQRPDEIAERMTLCSLSGCGSGVWFSMASFPAGKTLYDGNPGLAFVCL